MEITNAVAEHYGEKRRFPLPHIAFGVGYFEAFGHVKLETPEGGHTDPEKTAKPLDFYRKIIESEGVLDTLLAGLNIPKFQEGSQEHQVLVEATRMTREASKGKSFTALKREYILNMTDRVFKSFNDAVIDLGVLVNGLHPCMPDKFRTTEFLETIPLIHVWSDLHLYLYHKNLEMSVEINDMYDIGHLAVAIPYCDVVVCDKKLASVVKSSGLDKKYNTEVFSNLSKAVDYLDK